MDLEGGLENSAGSSDTEVIDPEFLPTGYARFGWMIGASAVDEERDPVHVKLIHNGAKYQIGRRHARLSLGSNSNDPMISARKGKAVRIDGTPVGSDLPTVLSPPQRIQIGTLHYRLEWTGLGEATDRPSMTEVAQLEIWPSSKPEFTSQAGQKRRRSTE
jgi:hypothetical protein